MAARRAQEERDGIVALERQRQELFRRPPRHRLVDLAEDGERAVLQQGVLEKRELPGGRGGLLCAIRRPMLLPRRRGRRRPQGVAHADLIERSCGKWGILTQGHVSAAGVKIGRR